MSISYFLKSNSQTVAPASLVGGKAKNLLWLNSHHVIVPDFFILTTESYHYYQKENKLPDSLIKSLENFLSSHPNEKFAVRSSVTGEDGVSHSFAGLFETFLNCLAEEVSQKILEAYASINDSRVHEYIKAKKIDASLSMALVIQVMSPSVKSGVVFSRSPIAPHSVMVIDAGLGLGEGVVSGHTDVETIQLTRLLEITSQHGPTILTKDEIVSIASTCLKLEHHYKTACDIEWSIDDKGVLNILQIRPITQYFSTLKVLADTNLTESYPGVVSPFTALFVQKSYENVFIESAIALGASGERLKDLSVHYAQLIAEVDNHLYYDLEHYYAILRALPGGDKNIDNWHRMIGGKLDFSYIPLHGKPFSLIETSTTIFSLLKFIIRHKSIFSGFLEKIQKTRDQVEDKIKNFTSGPEAMNYLSELIETRFDFGLTIVNDVVIMMGLGILKKRLSSLSESELIELLKTKEEVTSVKPLHAIEHLSHLISDSFLKRLKEVQVNNWLNPYEDFFIQEEKLGEKESVQALKDFLYQFGDRSFEELKLESFTFKQDPALLAQTILWMRQQNPVQKRKNEAKVHSFQLGTFDKKVLHITQQAIEMRETTRMWRGKFYNLMRENLIKGAALLKAEDSSWGNFELRDFFSLTHLEWNQFSQGKISQANVQDLMKERSSWKTKQKKFPEFLIWDIHEPLPQVGAVKSSSSLKGVGVSMGTIQGKCLVIEKPEEAFEIENIHDYILVTKNTDPAWVFIMSKSRGLISEKGSLLSHTAIIGRELNIPTIVGVSGVTHQLKTNDLIELNPLDGTIKLL